MSARAAPSEHPGPQPDCRRLGNGLGLVLLSQPSLAKAAISLRVAAGSHDEPLDYPGLAHFLEHLLFLGSAGFAGEQRLMPFVQACGGQLNASTQAHHTDYFCEVPAQRLEDALARLLDMLVRPLFEPEAQVRTCRGFVPRRAPRCRRARRPPAQAPPRKIPRPPSRPPAS